VIFELEITKSVYIKIWMLDNQNIFFRWDPLLVQSSHLPSKIFRQRDTFYKNTAVLSQYTNVTVTEKHTQTCILWKQANATMLRGNNRLKSLENAGSVMKIS